MSEWQNVYILTFCVLIFYSNARISHQERREVEPQKLQQPRDRDVGVGQEVGPQGRHPVNQLLLANLRGKIIHLGRGVELVGPEAVAVHLAMGNWEKQIVLVCVCIHTRNRKYIMLVLEIFLTEDP